MSLNFTQEIKRDLIALFPKDECCKRAAVAALLKTSGIAKPKKFEFVSENEKVTGYFLALVEGAFGVRPEVKEATFDPKREKDKLTLSCEGESAEKVLRGIEEFESPPEEEHCAVCYLRAAYLGGGSCTLPREGATTGYHLEVVFGDEESAENFGALLERFELLPKLVKRKKGYVVYFKSRDLISDFLSIVGAESALATLESVSSKREAQNNLNRSSNCAAGNADKTAIASVMQVSAFEKLKERGILATLPAPLKEAAIARMESPELALSELAQKLGITKSCLNHRLRKLMEIYRTEEIK